MNRLIKNTSLYWLHWLCWLCWLRWLCWLYWLYWLYRLNWLYWLYWLYWLLPLLPLRALLLYWLYSLRDATVTRVLGKMLFDKNRHNANLIMGVQALVKGPLKYPTVPWAELTIFVGDAIAPTATATELSSS